MLSDDAFKIAIAVRQFLTPDKQGIGPDIGQLLSLDGVKDMPPPDIARALDELNRYGYIDVIRGVGERRQGIPEELRGIAGVTILEPLQQLLDSLELKR
jgi:hypothetical protein